MKGVDEFVSLEQANKCREKAERRLQAFPICCVVSVIYTLIMIISSSMEEMPVVLTILLVPVGLACSITLVYYGFLSYLLKIITIPIRQLGLVSIVAYGITFFWFFASVMICSYVPLVAMLYGKSLCEKTIMNTNEL